MRKLLVVLACVALTVGALSLTALSQTGVTIDSNHPHTRGVLPISAIPVPGTSAANPFVNFDAAYFNPELQLLTVSSRSSKAVAIFDAATDKVFG